eukprot:m51a1_g2542 hypothetical protein (250) ;mRNA; r:277464-278766
MEEANWTEFERGARGVFSQWTVLQLALENQWAGPETADKVDALVEYVLDLFYDSLPASAAAPEGAQPQPQPQQAKQRIYADEVEDVLDDFLQGDISACVEDGSVEQVAALLVRLHAECAAGDFAAARKAAQEGRGARKAGAHAKGRMAASAAELAPAVMSQGRVARAAEAKRGLTEEDVEAEASDNDGDDSDSPAPAAAVDGADDVAMEDVAAPAAPTAPAAAAAPAPAPDADGWSTVAPKRKGKGGRH